MQVYRKAFKGVQSTGGAVPVRNEKGEMVMEKVKVRRHRAGHVPSYANEDESSSEDDEPNALGAIAENARAQQRRGDAGEVQEMKLSDRRLQRLQSLDDDDEELDTGTRRRRRRREDVVEDDSDDEGGEGGGGGGTVEDDTAVRRRRPQQDEDSSDGDEDEYDEDNEGDRRRARMRARAAQDGSEDEMPIAKEDDDGEEEEESGSEWETASSSDDEEQMQKIVFVSKSKRTTQLEREAKEKTEEQAVAEHEAKRAARVAETQQLVAQEMQHALDAEHSKLLKITDIDDNDEGYNEEEEFEKWKVRELKRIKRDREERATEEAERVETERIRDMSEEQRMAELAKREEGIGKKKERVKLKFMQKYHHKGAFYQDDDAEILKRDTSEATGEDHFDKAAMPKVMQVKSGMFGKMSQTKYTHLVDEDTSSKDSLFNQGLRDNRNQNQGTKRAGVKPVFERPSKRRG